MAGVSTFTDEMADVICERISNGESLKGICEDADTPSKSTVFKWLADIPAFSDKYARAREMQADSIFDEILDIADDARNDWMKARGSDGEDDRYVLNGEHVQRMKLRIDARKWMAGKLRPKKYGDKVTNEITGADGGPVSVETNYTDRDRAKATASILAKGLAKAKTNGSD